MSNGNLYDSPVCRVGSESTASPQQFTASPVRRSVATRSTVARTNWPSPVDSTTETSQTAVSLSLALTSPLSVRTATRSPERTCSVAGSRKDPGPGEVVCAYWSIGVTITRSATKNFSNPARTTRKTPTPSSTGPKNRRMDFPSSPQPR